MRVNKVFLEYIYFLVILILVTLLWVFGVSASTNGKIIRCDEATVQKVRVASGRLTILSFPIAPKDVLPGEAQFDFKRIKNDIAIKSLRVGAKTNIFIYLQERRCGFDLVTVPSGGDDILFVRDPKERQIEVKYHE